MNPRIFKAILFAGLLSSVPALAGYGFGTGTDGKTYCYATNQYGQIPGGESPVPVNYCTQVYVWGQGQDGLTHCYPAYSNGTIPPNIDPVPDNWCASPSPSPYPPPNPYPPPYPPPNPYPPPYPYPNPPPPPPPPPNEPRVCFFVDTNYSGGEMCLYPGQSLTNLANNGWNDKISSILVEGNANAYVCSDANFQGHCATVSQSMAALWNINNINFNDVISSIRVQ